MLYGDHLYEFFAIVGTAEFCLVQIGAVTADDVPRLAVAIFRRICRVQTDDGIRVVEVIVEFRELFSRIELAACPVRIGLLRRSLTIVLLTEREICHHYLLERGEFAVIRNEKFEEIFTGNGVNYERVVKLKFSALPSGAVIDIFVTEIFGTVDDCLLGGAGA